MLDKPQVLTTDIVIRFYRVMAGTQGSDHRTHAIKDGYSNGINIRSLSRYTGSCHNAKENTDKEFFIHLMNFKSNGLVI